MFEHSLAFDSPAYLWLLLLLPVIWIGPWRALGGLGRVRRILALLLRSAVLVLIVLALAEVQLVQRGRRMAVVFVLDQSKSIPRQARQAMAQYAKQAVRRHRQASRRDAAGVVVFARDAAVEVAPYDDELFWTGEVESLGEQQLAATNLAAALKMAQAVFPEDAAKRVVVITDGKETIDIGAARRVAQVLARSGIGIDVVPVDVPPSAEISIETLNLPTQVRAGQPFEATIVLHHQSGAGRQSRAGGQSQTGQSVSGTVRLYRRVGRRQQVVYEEKGVELAPGEKLPLPIPQELKLPDYYTYEAQFIPDDPSVDRIRENNRVTAYTHVRGKGSVLFIEDWTARNTTGGVTRGRFHYLVERLKAMELEVRVQFTDELFTSLADLQRFDTVVLANVPRSSGADAAKVTNFSDEQVQMLVRNTQQMGAGLVMLGGESSFGAGGWAGSDLEEAMPVDFQIKSKKVRIVGALAMVMHAAEIPQANYWQRLVCREALKALGPMDYCGIVTWNGAEQWLWRDAEKRGVIAVGDNRQRMMAALDRMAPGDMMDFAPSMKMSLQGLLAVKEAAVRHMIIVSDGDPTAPPPALVQQFAAAGIKISTVAIGSHVPPGGGPLPKIAAQTGGKFYNVTSPRALPRIYQREVRRVARPLIYDQEPVLPELGPPHEVIQGIDGVPPVGGYVMTTVKQNPLVEVLMSTSEPAGRKNGTILAAWTYGLGRAAVLTTDAGSRWAKQWPAWPEYDALFGNLIRWSMRKTSDDAQLQVATEYRDGKIHVVVNALDENDDYLSVLSLPTSVVGPDMKPFELRLPQTEPGRYEASFDADAAGSYFVTVSSRQTGPVTAGLSVPYSPEFRQRPTNMPLLTDLADTEPEGGRPGRLVSGELTGSFDKLLESDPFRADLAFASSRQAAWPLFLLFAAFVFFADVAIRRVAIRLQPVARLWAKLWSLLRRRPAPPPVEQTIQRLRSRKAAVQRELDEKRASTRYEADPDRDPSDLDLAEISQKMEDPAKPAGRGAVEHGGATVDKGEEPSYTERLLEAKRKIARRREEEQ